MIREKTSDNTAIVFDRLASYHIDQFSQYFKQLNAPQAERQMLHRSQRQTVLLNTNHVKAV